MGNPHNEYTRVAFCVFGRERREINVNKNEIYIYVDVKPVDENQQYNTEFGG